MQKITKSRVGPNGVINCFPKTLITFPCPPGVSKEKWCHVEGGDVAAEDNSLLAAKALPKPALLVTRQRVGLCVRGKPVPSYTRDVLGFAA